MSVATLVAAAATAACIAGASASPPSPAPACQCDAGDYWCSSSGTLRVNYNCSGQQMGVGLWDRIINEDQPTDTDCRGVLKHCLQQPATAANRTCDDECYSWAWVKDVGDCADDDDSQTLCVSLAQEWCVTHRCGSADPWEGNGCASTCGLKFMQEGDESFVDFTNCMSKCTPTKVSPWGR
jgi:hypothetical protein